MTIPSHIGQYRILRRLGAGGMGLVFLGEHTLLGRRAAIKTLLPTVATNAEIVERFFNEARATSAIADPGVIQVFDFGYHVDGTAYIVMELLEGEPLSARIDRLGKLALGDALRLARQIAGSLAAAHARDIIHRDLKPDNIFLVHDAEAQGGERSKILDFGICKVSTSEATVTQSGAMVGTPVYMSPEQCRGTGKVDHRADVYAFGCLVFHMLTGRPPFVGEATGELIVAHLREEPPPASQFVDDLPPGVDALLLRCLAKDPDERFASMTDLLAALVELSNQLDAPASPVAKVAPQMPLGRGFRSMYDGNLAALLASSGGSDDSLRSRLRFAPTPSVTPASNDDFEADDRSVHVVTRPPRRARVGAALAGVLVIGVVLGLVATTLVIDSDDHRAAAESAQLPPEDEPDIEPPARAVEHEAAPASAVPAMLATTGADDPGLAARPAAPSGGVADQSRRPREAARDLKKWFVKPRMREPVPAVVMTASPRPPATPPAPPATPPAPSATSPAPSATLSAPSATPSPSVPAEDLYDTR